MKRSLLFLLILLILSSVAACEKSGPSADSVATAIQATEFMKQTLYPATSTATEAPPTETPTITLSPTATLEPHPIKLHDDFSSELINWLMCEECIYKNDALYMGPWPSSGAYIQHFAVCQDCGLVTYYYMSVIATYEDGPSERGYGLLLRLTDEYAITLEITPLQTVAVWKLDFETGAFDLLDGRWSGAVKAGVQTNHIEVYVTESSQGRADISVSVNGKNVFIVWGQPKDQSPVGLTLWGHALEVQFDDFIFEEYEPYGDPIELEDFDRPSGG